MTTTSLVHITHQGLFHEFLRVRDDAVPVFPGPGSSRNIPLRKSHTAGAIQNPDEGEALISFVIEGVILIGTAKWS